MRSTQGEWRDRSLRLSQVATPEFGSDVCFIPHADQDSAPLGTAAHCTDLLFGARQALRESQAPLRERTLKARAFGRERRVGAEVAQFLRIGQEVEQHRPKADGVY